ARSIGSRHGEPRLSRPGLPGRAFGVRPRGGRRPRRRAGAECARSARSELNAAGARPQLLELADAALLAPGLILRLTDAVYRLCLRRAQPLEGVDVRASERGARGEIGRSRRPHDELGSDETDVQRHILEVLPADVAHVETAEKPARDPQDRKSTRL